MREDVDLVEQREEWRQRGGVDEEAAAHHEQREHHGGDNRGRALVGHRGADQHDVRLGDERDEAGDDEEEGELCEGGRLVRVRVRVRANQA